MVSTQAREPGARSAEEEKELAFGQIWKDAGSSHLPDRPKLSDIPENGRRKSSIQFNTAPAEETIRRESVVSGGQTTRASISQTNTRRMSSPPPPPTYQRGVSFDTFRNHDAIVESLSLNYKHRDYTCTSRSRTFLCGTDAKDYSEYALEWMIDELVDDGDEIVCLRVIEKDSKEATGVATKYREEAQKLLDSVVAKNQSEEKAISLVMELAYGRVQEIIQIMIQMYEPAVLVVGTRGRNLGGVQGLLPGSVSKYCLQHSPIPVVVVRPSSKRLRKKQKRQLLTGRSLYGSMLDKAQTTGGASLYDKPLTPTVTSAETAAQEANAVAAAIGPPKRGILKGRTYGGPLARVTSGASDTDVDINEPVNARFALPIGFLATESAPRADLAMQAPSIAMLAEDWSDDEINTKRKPVTPPRSPMIRSTKVVSGNKRRDSVEDAISDTEDGYLGLPKIVEHRRPSTKETTPWLASILNEKPPPRRMTGPK